jgi:hypothetical protein
LLAVGIPYCMIPYNKVNLPDALPGPGLLAVVAAVFLRIVVEGTADPTSHNLWPFEVIIAVGLGFSIAFAGAVIGRLAAKVSGTGGGEERA